MKLFMYLKMRRLLRASMMLACLPLFSLAHRLHPPGTYTCSVEVVTRKKEKKRERKGKERGEKTERNSFRSVWCGLGPKLVR
ncbi:hypothetical protein F5X96DRAFT_649357 [Biscogniauxia mediterranea]|nr:hypothetical protein F5X96DRAFT_649357 [Biscogniauxia mediterranea]